jgi:hypothetical protein
MAQIILDSNNNLIQGDFDNATLNNRTKLQTTTTNATTNVYVVPNGSSTSAGVSVANNSSLTNASKIVMATNGTTDTQIISGVNGSGTYLPLSFYTNNALAMQVATSGNVGIGTSAPDYPLHVQRGAGTAAYIGSAGNGNALTTSGMIIGQDSAGLSRWYQFGNNPLATFTNNVERTRVDGSGNFFWGGGSGGGGVIDNTIYNFYFPNANNGIGVRTDTTATSYHFRFQNPNGTVGGIYTNGANTTYTTSSDYRLKENVQPMIGALDKVLQLNPVTYTWKIDGSDGQGFIAHELQAIVPECVGGEKDAVDAEGKPQYQGVDTSFLVATLTAAIQELTERVKALESK